MKSRNWKLFAAFLVLALWTIRSHASDQSNAPGLGPETDTLYVGDGGDNTVKSFNAKSGTNDKAKTFVPETDPTSPLSGPSLFGLLVAGGELIVVNQNNGTDFPGDIQQFLLTTAKFAGFLVEKNDPAAPFIPHAAVLLNSVLYVSNITGNATDPAEPGAIYVFAGNGDSLGKLAPPLYLPNLAKRFFPRGIVLNPRDGLLYVSNCPNFTRAAGAGNGGQVLKFDPRTLQFRGVFVDDTGSIGGLNRPDGLVFGPNGNLYVTSFRFNPVQPNPPDPAALDSIRVYDRFGRFLESIPLDKQGEPRAFAQAILFGPDGKLFVPINGNGPETGEIRRYDVRTKNYSVFVEVGILGSPQYLTFGRTDSATLAYGLESGASEH
jgi:DNA-binding beta-propeller fold protein YncE